MLGLWREKVWETGRRRRYLGLPCPLHFHEDGSATNGCGAKGTRAWGLGEGKVWAVGGNSYGVLGGLGVERILAGGVLLAMRNTGFSIVFSLTPWGGIPSCSSLSSSFSLFHLL